LCRFTSKIDSKGRISIPLQLRAKLRLLEGSNVSIFIKNKQIVLTPVKNDQSNVTASIDFDSAKVCGTSRPSSNLGSCLKKVRGDR